MMQFLRLLSLNKTQFRVKVRHFLSICHREVYAAKNIRVPTFQVVQIVLTCTHTHTHTHTRFPSNSTTLQQRFAGLSQVFAYTLRSLLF